MLFRSAEGISDDRLRDKITPELRYACIYWPDHFKGADVEDINLIKKVAAFATECLLYWLEVMSWICKLELAPPALLAAHTLLVTFHLPSLLSEELTC